MTTASAVADLYRARWGEPSRRAAFRVDGIEAEVFKWNAEANPEGVCLYATVGASSWSAAGRNPGHQLEFFTGLLPDCDEIASPLAALALYGFKARHGAEALLKHWEESATPF